ncbi:cell division protein FtsK [Niabella ginsenosidivorans]|uniref:Cell division protein FtsK n=1 Tax=Niabella ginsenosidivorans TaxID=1176587 RepID=A0A1A9HZD3_9BACT|nr:DNA translocase FtsK [Niabella ginsenosidivorans]ANH80169.1 cell division protein FtsK [Niabella ginsenosidivorans]
MANKSKSKNKRPTARTNTKKAATGTWKVEKEEKVQLKALAKDERTWKIAGTTFLLVAVFLIISFVSYFFTWKQDFTQISRGSAILWDFDVSVNNLLGKLGALAAHFFIYKLFGVAAVLICTFFFVVGVNLMWRRRVFSVWRNLKYVTLGMLAGSAILAYLLPNEEFRYGGGVGNMIVHWLVASLGQIGAGAVLGLIVIAYFIWQFNPVFSFPGKLKRVNGAPPPEPVTAGAGDEPEVKEPEAVEKIAPVQEGAKLIIDVDVEKPKYDIKLVNKEPEVHAKEEEEGYERITVLKPGIKKPDPVIEKADAAAAQELNIPAAEKTGSVKQEEDLKLEINSDPIAPVQPAVADEKKKPYEPALNLRNYKKPTTDLLETHGSEKVVQDPNELENNKNQIIQTLRNYDIEIQKISATVGPTVTLYEIVPAAGVRISKIKNLEDDIALSLSALGIRIIAPIPGRGTIGIEVPNARKTIVSMKTLLASEEFTKSSHSLPIALGKRIDNKNFIVDLATMPHLLMAGATGQGKSVGINAILVSLLYSKHPSQLKFVLVDPKKVELSVYSQIVNHFLARLPNEEDAIITDTKKVINTLNALCIEMDNRYDLLKDAGCRNIKEYNAKFAARKLNPERGHMFMPFIVLVVDEFADLIMTAGKEVEMPIARLAQLARAVGIHLIIATQRPSVNIITGIIKANFPARIAFKVSSKIDSRTILDAGGADQLIGKGDMLISLNGEISRLQCAFVDTPEVDKVVDFIAYQEGYPEPFLLPEYIDEKDLEAAGDFDPDDRDSLFEDAARLIVANQIGSTSLLQRRMKLGYNRAGRLMDQLEQAGIVGPNQGSKAREVLIKTEAELQQHLDMLG